MTPAFASDNMDINSNNVMDSSSQVLAARSGGRMGGRSSMGTRGSYGGSRGSYGGGTSYSRTTVVRPMASPSVIVDPTPIFSPFGISPFGGFGTYC